MQNGRIAGWCREREAGLPDLERARAEEPLAPAYASFLSQAESAGGDLASALAEVGRGLKLEGLDTLLQGIGFSIALTREDRAEIRRRVDAMSDDPGSRSSSIS